MELLCRGAEKQHVVLLNKGRVDFWRCTDEQISEWTELIFDKSTDEQISKWKELIFDRSTDEQISEWKELIFNKGTNEQYRSKGKS